VFSAQLRKLELWWPMPQGFLQAARPIWMAILDFQLGRRAVTRGPKTVPQGNTSLV